MASVFGCDDDDDDEALVPVIFLIALDELEDAVQRPGMPAGLTARDAVGLGYLTHQHVVEALAAAKRGLGDT